MCDALTKDPRKLDSFALFHKDGTFIDGENMKKRISVLYEVRSWSDWEVHE